jgi:hypothetical protein
MGGTPHCCYPIRVCSTCGLTRLLRKARRGISARSPSGGFSHVRLTYCYRCFINNVTHRIRDESGPKLGANYALRCRNASHYGIRPVYGEFDRGMQSARSRTHNRSWRTFSVPSAYNSSYRIDRQSSWPVVMNFD